MCKIIEKLRCELTESEMKEIAIKLNRSYEPFKVFFSGWDIIYDVFPTNSHKILNELKEGITPHELFNEFVIRFCENERVIKFHLAKQHINNDDEIGVFEFNVNDSRLDFGVINGNSYAYEIKTERDTTYRLDKQLKDYKKAFEYVNVVTHIKHIEKVKKIVGREIGIMVYELNEKECEFTVVRKPKLNKGIQKKIQLELLLSEELKRGLIGKGMASKSIPSFKEEKKKKIERVYSKEELNLLFKESVKARQKEKWDHVKVNFDKLYPIDLQECYTNLFKPELCY